MRVCRGADMPSRLAFGLVLASNCAASESGWDGSAFWAGKADAAGAPAAATPISWNDAATVLGVNTHHVGALPAAEMDLLQQAGFRWIRNGCNWGDCEVAKGVYSFNSTRCGADAFMAQIAARDIGVIFIVGDGNAAYGMPRGFGWAPNVTQENIAAFARFNAALATEYASSNRVLFELIEEPNTGGRYTAPRFAQAIFPAARAVRAAGGMVAAPSSANIDFPFLQELMELGLGDVSDYLTVHPYRADAPETFLPDAERIQAMIARYTPLNNTLRLSQGEVGYSYGEENPTTATPIDTTTQAKLAVRMFLTALAANALPAIWYDWKSDPVIPGCHGGNCGEHMGVVDSSLKPLPSWHAVRALNVFISGMRFVARAGVCHTDPCLTMSDDFALTFRNASHALIAAWSVDSFNHSASLKFTRGCWQSYNWMGKSGPVLCPHGHLDRRLSLNFTNAGAPAERYINLYLTDAPVYLLQRLKTDDQPPRLRTWAKRRAFVHMWPSADTRLKNDDGSMSGNTTAAARLDGVRNLYNNDAENLLTVNSSYHRSMAPITDSVVRGSVYDTHGSVDANLIMPFHGVPWWNSSIEPPQAHRDWYDKTFGFDYDPNGGSQLDYIMRGGDLIGTFADEAIKEGQKPLISISMNDAQMCNCPPRSNGYKSMAANDHTFSYVSRTFYEHRFDKEAMLGYGQNPPTPWRPCCWALGNASCANDYACNEKACEFSWLSPVMPQRLVRLIGEVSEMYGNRVAGIELCVRCAGDYFPLKTAQAVRNKLMMAFVRQVRLAMDAATEGLGLPQLALGLQLSPDWGNLRAVGLADLAQVVAPTTAGGAGVTYLNWAVASRSVFPFDCALASLAAATPPGTPWFFNIQSWTYNGPAPGTPGSNASFSCDVKVRITKEELWTTALVARAYGARGLAAFNFIYTRYYSDGGCELAAGVPYSEPLFAAYGQTRNDTFISTADQYYRLSSNLNPVPGQLGHDGASLYPSKNDFGLELELFMVPPAGGWQQQGRLRLRTKLPLGSTHGVVPSGVVPSSAERLYVSVNGHALTINTNVSSIFPTGVQAILAHYPDELWHAWNLPIACLRPGNNTVQIALRNTGTDAAVTHLDIGLPVTARALPTPRLKLDDDSTSELGAMG